MTGKNTHNTNYWQLNYVFHQIQGSVWQWFQTLIPEERCPAGLTYFSGLMHLI